MTDAGAYVFFFNFQSSLLFQDFNVFEKYSTLQTAIRFYLKSFSVVFSRVRFLHHTLLHPNSRPIPLSSFPFPSGASLHFILTCSLRPYLDLLSAMVDDSVAAAAATQSASTVPTQPAGQSQSATAAAAAAAAAAVAAQPAAAYANQMAAQTQMMQQQTRQAQLQQQHNMQELNAKLQQFWAEQMTEVQQATDFKNHLLPLARIKKIMKSDEDVRMISAEAPVLFAKACEMFILELTHRAWAQTEEAKRRTLQRSDISAAIQKTDIFDFLIDIVPRDDPKKEDVRPVTGTVDQSQMQYYAVPNMPSAAYAVPTQMNPTGAADTSAAMMYSAAPQQVYASAGYAPGVPYQPGMVNAQYMRVPQQVMYAPPGYPTQYITGGAATQDQQPPPS